jgi:hypothetical protein
VSAFADESEEELANCTSIGSWAACDECAALIQKLNRKGLVERSKEMWDKDPVHRSKHISDELVLSFLTEALDAFWANRTGPGYRGHDLESGTEETVEQN